MGGMPQAWKITTSPAVTYRARSAAGAGWAMATIREWPQGGSLDVQSDYGTFSYSWSAIGSGTLREFLCSLDFSYFMGKTQPTSHRQFDFGKSVALLKSEICRWRREESLTKDQARQVWEELWSVFEGECLPSDLYYEKASEAFFTVLDNGFDYTDIPIDHSDNPQCRMFWDGPWQALCEHWRAELNLKCEAA